MSHLSKRGYPIALGIAPFALLVVLAGCSKSSDSGGAGGAASAAGGDAQAAAQATFKANCSNCHALGGVGGGRAPDLSHVGAEPEHTADWIANFIKSPRSQRMPSFAGKIPDADIQTLATYLASQK